jgi:hypothetical protein
VSRRRFEPSDSVANFKEAGEAKENYDLRTIFDNTSVVFFVVMIATDRLAWYRGDPLMLCKSSLSMI